MHGLTCPKDSYGLDLAYHKLLNFFNIYYLSPEIHLLILQILYSPQVSVNFHHCVLDFLTSPTR